jgi:hypothetical protein
LLSSIRQFFRVVKESLTGLVDDFRIDAFNRWPYTKAAPGLSFGLLGIWEKSFAVNNQRAELLYGTDATSVTGSNQQFTTHPTITASKNI